MNLKDEVSFFLEDVIEFALGPHTLYRAITGLPMNSYYLALNRIQKEKKSRPRRILKSRNPAEIARWIDHANQTLHIPWGEIWHGVVFDIPQTQHALRMRLKRFLENLGFGAYQKSFFVHPHDRFKEVQTFVTQYNTSENISCFQFKPTMFSNIQAFINKAWNLSLLKKSYEDFSQITQKRIDNFTALSKTQTARTRKYIARWINKVMDQSLFEILRKDPLLPITLLPNQWPLEKVLYAYPSWKVILKEHI